MTRQLTAPVVVTFGVLGPVIAATERGPVPCGATGSAWCWAGC